MTGPQRGTEMGEFFEAVHERLPLYELIGRDVKLRRSGNNYRGACPFHHGQNPNFSVSAEFGGYHCFQCEVSGNYLEWMLAKGGFTDKREALRFLSEQTGVVLPPNPRVDRFKEEASAADTRAKRDALFFAYQLFRQARVARAGEFDEACAAAGLDPRWSGLLGACYAPAGNKLSANVQKRVAPAAWRAFAQVGVLDFTGEPGSPESRASMCDSMAPGIVWPLVTSKNLLIGLAQIDAVSGVRTLCTQGIGSFAEPRHGALLTSAREARRILGEVRPGDRSGEGRAADDTSDSPEPPPDSMCLVWSSAREYLQFAPALTGRGGISAPVRHVVPAGDWNLSSPRSAALRGLRAQIRGVDRPVGVVSPDAELGTWTQPEWLRLSGAVVAFDRDAPQPEHIFEYGLRVDSTYDPSDAIEGMLHTDTADGTAEPLSPRILALRGWWRQTEAAMRAARHKVRPTLGGSVSDASVTRYAGAATAPACEDVEPWSAELSGLEDAG